MFRINEDLTIECTRGDVGVFTVGANIAGVPYTFQPSDVIRISVCSKKNYSDVVMRKDTHIGSPMEAVEIELDEKDTRFGVNINKPTDFYYEVELNPDGYPQTIIGHDEKGAKIFRLYPESIKEG